MTKRTRRTLKKKESDYVSRIVKIASLIAAGMLLIAAAVGGGYYFGYNDAMEKAERLHQAERQKMASIVKKLEHAEKETASIESLNQKLKSVLDRDKEYAGTAAHEYSDGKGEAVKPPEGPKRTYAKGTALPKLAIIIDDVSFAHDVKAIRATGLPLTMSFLPPSKRHPHSAELAAKEPFYMVHLPLEAERFSSEEPFTLQAGDSQRTIRKRIAQIRELFPKVRYVNNHTGSKFTANELAMNRLIYALHGDGIQFIDSRTTAATKVPAVMQNYGKPYIARDVFLDHESDIDAIKKQIERAVTIAKKHGTAIAIGHPRKETLEALRQSTNLLKGVEVVRIDKLQ